MTRRLKEIAEFVQGQLVGDGAIEITGIASIESAADGDLTFIEDDKNVTKAARSRASAVIAGMAAPALEKPCILCEQPRLAFAQAAAFLFAPEYPMSLRRTEGDESLAPSNAHVGTGALASLPRAEPRGPAERSSAASAASTEQTDARIHEMAVVHPSASVGNNVSIEAHVTVDANAEIGSRTRVGAGSRIGRNARIGSDCNLAPNVTIYPGVRLGDRVIVHAGAVLGSDGFGYVRDPRTGRYTKFPQVGQLEIEDDVEIGANSTIDRGALDLTRIGRGTKIDNLVHVAHNVQIGEDVVIAAQTGLSGSAVLEDGVVVAGQVGIADHVRIESGVILGAQCGVPSKKVIRGKGIVFWGTPARPIREYLKELAVLARLAKKS